MSLGSLWKAASSFEKKMIFLHAADASSMILPDFFCLQRSEVISVLQSHPCAALRMCVEWTPK
jgi:hypothetical protein